MSLGFLCASALRMCHNAHKFFGTHTHTHTQTHTYQQVFSFVLCQCMIGNLFKNIMIYLLKMYSTKVEYHYTVQTIMSGLYLISWCYFSYIRTYVLLLLLSGDSKAGRINW